MDQFMWKGLNIEQTSNPSLVQKKWLLWKSMTTIDDADSNPKSGRQLYHRSDAV